MTSHLVLLAAALALGAASAPTAIDLPPPQKTGGMPLMEALARRITSRAFETRELSTQQLSDLLWAAFGVSRPDGKRTAPSSMDKREITLHVLTARGVFTYDAEHHRLVPRLAEDLRALSGKQDFVHDAPVTLVFVADLARMADDSRAGKEATACFDTGFISQNVYLYCASTGLATGVRAWVDRDALGRRLGLRPDQFITAAQSVGHPKR